MERKRNEFVGDTNPGTAPRIIILLIQTRSEESTERLNQMQVQVSSYKWHEMGWNRHCNIGTCYSVGRWDTLSGLMELIAAGFGVSIQCAVPGVEEVRGNGTLRRRGCSLGLRAPVVCGTKAGGPTREDWRCWRWRKRPDWKLGG